MKRRSVQTAPPPPPSPPPESNPGWTTDLVYRRAIDTLPWCSHAWKRTMRIIVPPQLAPSSSTTSRKTFSSVLPTLACPLALLALAWAVYQNRVSERALHDNDIYGNNTNDTSSSSHRWWSVVYMMALALTYALQPTVARHCIRADTSKVVTALCEELVKSALALALYCHSIDTTSRTPFVSHPWSWRRSLSTAGLPAVLYAIQGVWQYQAQSRLDAVTYTGLQQGKTPSAALACYLLLNERRTVRQVLALAMLWASSVVLLVWRTPQRRESSTQPSSGTAITTTTTIVNDADDTNATSTTRWRAGLWPCLGATLISGVAGTLSQQGLSSSSYSTNGTTAGGIAINPYLYALEVSVYSAVCLAVQHGLVSSWHRRRGTNAAAETGARLDLSSSLSWRLQKKNRHWWLWIPVTLKAVGGILTVLVHKHSGTVSKGFALTFGLIFAALVERMWTGRTMPAHQVVATLLVIAAGHWHF